MASGLPDYYSRSYVNIDQQTISQVAIDIAKQSLANLDININKQTVSELAIDIARQSIATLGIDIQNQSVGNLAMDIAQQSLGNLAVDIGQQSIGNLDINIKNQEISELSIDIAKQTIGQILQRPIYGTAQSIYEGYAVSTTGLYTLVNISGQGKTYGGFVRVEGGTDHYEDLIRLKGDGSEFFSGYISNLMERGIGPSSDCPLYILMYDQPNDLYVIGIKGDLTFESSFQVVIDVINNADGQYSCQLSYALI
jgi:hypothetical protein